jgi:hypothetical protein
MACAHSQDFEWRDCDKVDHEEGCFVATCPLCGYESRDCEEGVMACTHRVIRWLHSDRVRGCEDCDSATEYEQGEQTPCSISVCAACSEITDPATDEHHKQLLADA